MLIVVKPDGRLLQMGSLLPVVRTLPLANVFFRDFFWIGVAMLLALGIPNSIAAVMLVRRSEKRYLAALAAGVFLVLWCSFELIYMFNVPAVGYFVVGVLSVLSSVSLSRSAMEAGA